MEKSLCLGLALGVTIGALITANSYKLRKFVKQGQDQMMQKVEKAVEAHSDGESQE